MPPRLAVAAVSAALVSSAADGSAEPSRPGPAFGSEAGEVALAVAAAGTLTARFIPQRKSDWGPSHAAEFEFDVGLVSDYVGAGIGAGLQIAAGYALETSYLASHDQRGPAVSALRTAVIEVESLMLSGGLTTAVKKLVGRCRPRAYRYSRCEGGEYDAFPSGHTSAVGSFGGSRLVTVLRSDPDDARAGIRWASFGLAEAGIVAAGTLRVAAHAHSWEDVVGGALLGHAAGILIAIAHPEEPLDQRAGGAARTRSRQGRGAAQSPPSGAAPLTLGWSGEF